MVRAARRADFVHGSTLGGIPARNDTPGQTLPSAPMDCIRNRRDRLGRNWVVDRRPTVMMGGKEGNGAAPAGSPFYNCHREVQQFNGEGESTMNTAKPSKRTPRRAGAATLPMRDGFNATWAEVKTAAEKLGYDVSRKNWTKSLREESSAYPFTLEGDDQEILEMLPKRSYARIRALELIDSLIEFLTDIEEGLQKCDARITELRTQLATHPASIPVAANIRQIEEVA
jgi:hypothetical protein